MRIIPKLPPIMVAPNGAYKSKKDHAMVPITVDEVVTTARACFDAGASGLHAHVRDSDGQHCIDAALYRELLNKLSDCATTHFLQITTEAVGRFTAQDQRDLVYGVKPPAVSVALKEQWPDQGPDKAASEFYHWAHTEGISIQHILYDADDVQRLAALVKAGDIPDNPIQMLFVLGRYSKGQESQPSTLDPFLYSLKNASHMREVEWSVCAFGRAETECLAYAHSLGGNIRIGFENSLFNASGEIAKDNADRVREIVRAIL